MKRIKFKNFIWGIICLIAASITTYKLTLIYFYYIAATNNTTAPFAALLTSIPFGFILFHLSVTFYKHVIKITRHTLKIIA